MRHGDLPSLGDPVAETPAVGVALALGRTVAELMGWVSGVVLRGPQRAWRGACRVGVGGEEDGGGALGGAAGVGGAVDLAEPGFVAGAGGVCGGVGHGGIAAASNRSHGPSIAAGKGIGACVAWRATAYGAVRVKPGHSVKLFVLFRM